MLIAIFSIFYLIVACIISLVAIPIGYLIGLFSKKVKDRYCLKCVQISLKAFLFTTRTKVTYKGLENLPKKGDEAVCYVANHTGFFDIIASYPKFHDLTGFVAKSEMKKWPVIGWWMPLVYCLFLDRNDSRQGVKTILAGINNIKNGVSMVIFPEGTRSKKEGELLEFHSGSFKLATKNKTTIIPIAFNNAGSVFENVFPHMKPTKMCVEFLEPIVLKDMSKEELNALPDRVRNLIYDRIIANGKEIGSVPEDYERPSEEKTNG